MANKIQIKRGNKANLPALSDGELAFCKDAGEVYVGNGGTNQQIGALVQSGTWTPSLSAATGYSTRVGVYTRIGNLVVVHCNLTFAYTDNGAYMDITGFPFAAARESSALLANYTNNIFHSKSHPRIHIAAGSSCARVQLCDTDTDNNVYCIDADYHDTLFVRSGTMTLCFTLAYLLN